MKKTKTYNMITDRIIWPGHYKVSEADFNVEADVAADGLSAEQVWPYLINIADIDRFAREISDAEPLDPQVNDPHLYSKEEFTINADRYTAHARVLEAIPPKGDRVGRITWEGEAQIKNSDQKFSFVHARVLYVEKPGKLYVVSALSIKGKTPGEQFFANLNQGWLNRLVQYVRRKETRTNHPRKPSSGAMVK